MTGRRARRADGYWDELAREGVPVEPLRPDGTTAPPTAGSSRTAPLAVAPSRSDAVVRSASQVIGGPAGRRLASGTGFWRALPVLILLATAMLGLGVVQKQHCREQGWSTPDQFWHACYSDIPVLYGSSGLGQPDRPGLVDTLGPGGIGTPPLTGAAMWVVSAFVPDHGSDSPGTFFDLSAVLLLVFLVAAVGAVVVVLVRSGRPWDAAHLALSPVLLTAALVSYQLLAVMLLALAVLAWTRERSTLAGVLLGAAVSSSPVLWLLAPLAVLLGIRSGKPVPAATGAGWALVTWFLLRVALLPGLFGGLVSGWHDWARATPGYGSVWMIPELLDSSRPDSVQSVPARILFGLFGWLFDGGSVSAGVASTLAVVLGALAIGAALWFGLGGGPRLSERPLAAVPGDELRLFAPLALAVLSIGLITLRSVPVQASLLLLPLIALTGLRWRDHLVWAGAELAYFVGVWLYIAADTTPDRGLPAFFYLVLLLLRLAAIAHLGVRGVLAARAAVSPRTLVGSGG